MDAIGVKLIPFDLPGRIPQMGSNNGMEKGSIFRVPRRTRDRYPTAYTPSVISIGPYHHGQPDLSNLDEHKLRAFQKLSSRSNKSYQDFSNELRKSLRMLRESYQQLDNAWNIDDEKFLWTMIYDGAFLWEYMGCRSGGATDYDDDDPVFGYAAAVRNASDFIRDILMIENQLPLKVLERLIAVVDGQLEQSHYPEVYRLVFNLLGLGQAPAPTLATAPCLLHILDVARKAIAKNTTLNSSANPHAGRVQSASELSKVGVAFKECGVRGTSEITFRHGTLYLAPLNVETFIEVLFLNSIIFEKLRPSAGGQVCSYVAFMSGLIRSEADVGLLRSQRLIYSPIEGDEDIANLISTISQGVFLDPFSNLCDIRDSLNNYYIKKVKSLRQGFRKWTARVLTFGGAFLLGLTILQSVYTVLAYYKGN